MKVLLRCVNDGVTTIKPEHQTTENARVIWSDESSFTLFPISGTVVQTGCGTHPASYPMGIGDTFPGDKAAGT
jgi:hypothetical protein